MRAYRLDEREFSPGDLMPYRGDCAHMLSNVEKAVEAALRAHATQSEDMRCRAQYFYLDEAYARRVAELSKQYGSGPPRRFYEVEISEADFLHRGDLNHYSAAKDAYVKGAPLHEHVAGYWSGSPAEGCWTSPRFEILAVQAVVVRKL